MAAALQENPGSDDLRIAAALSARGRLQDTDLARAQRLHAEAGGSLVALLVRLGMVSERDMAEAAAEAEAIVDLQVARFVETMAASTRTAPLKRLRAHGEAAKAEALSKARQQLASGQDPSEVLDFLAHTLTNRLLHAPTIALREAALTGNAELARAAEKLFPQVGPSDPQDDGDA